MSGSDRKLKKDVVAAVFLLLFSSAVIYFWLIAPVFSGSNSEANITAVYQVYDARGEEKEYFLNYWRSKNGFVARREYADRALTLVAYGDELYSRDSTGNIELLDRGFLPFYFPLDPVFGNYILKAAEELPGYRALGEIRLKGRRAAHLVFYSPFDSERRFETWIDIVTGLPLIFVEEDREGTIYSAELLSIKQIEVEPDDFQPAPDTTGVVDRFANARISPSLLQLRAGFQVFVPSVVPRRLTGSSFLVLSDPVIELLDMQINGKVAAVSFYGDDGFLCVYEYRGKLPDLKTENVIIEEINGRQVKLVSGPGYRTALIYEKPVAIVMLTNISYKELKNAIESMFE